MYHQDGWRAVNARDRCDVAEKHEAELVVERGVDRVRRDDQQERMPVRGRAHDCFGGYISAGPRTVLDHERLTETLRQPLSQQASGNVRPAPAACPTMMRTGRVGYACALAMREIAAS